MRAALMDELIAKIMGTEKDPGFPPNLKQTKICPSCCHSDQSTFNPGDWYCEKYKRWVLIDTVCDDHSG